MAQIGTESELFERPQHSAKVRCGLAIRPAFPRCYSVKKASSCIAKNSRERAARDFFPRQLRRVLMLVAENPHVIPKRVVSPIMKTT